MKKLMIWYHRRRAAKWAAYKFKCGSLIHNCYNHGYYKEWENWHLAQIARLEKQ